MRRTIALLFVALGSLTSGCPRIPAPRPPVTRPEDALVTAHGLGPLLDDADAASLRAAIGESLAWLDVQPPDRRFVFGPRTVTAGELRVALADFVGQLADDPTAADLATRIADSFDVLEAAGGADGKVLFTGYYEPVLEGSLTPDPAYPVPVYGMPDDVLEIPLEPFGDRFKGEKVVGRIEGRKVVPYWTRADIDAGRLAGRGLEIAWAKDPVSLFFVEVQGSGALALPGGGEKRIGYAGTNGRPYKSIGSLLIQEGVMTRETTSMQSLRAWLAMHPEHRPRVFHFNESFVFFRFLETAPVGALGRVVTPGRSIATDQRLFVPGAIGFIRTEYPAALPDGTIEWRPLSRFVVNQDTGGAIRGAGRVDVFWGRGPEAELAAGLMKQPGRLFFLVPRVRPGG